MTTDWDPQQYMRFAGERTRPARDLLAQVALASPANIFDLGCGPGNSTALLAARYPEARITGIDSSAAMLEQAQTACPAARFLLGDLNSWMPEEAPDLLFSNAALQWLPQHLAIMGRLIGTLAKGGSLAVQMPDNLGEPSHVLMQEVARQGRWAAKLAQASAARAVLPSPQVYYDLLKPCAARVDIWHTIYNHPLEGVGGIVAWLSTTGLRPYLDPLDDNEHASFLAAYQSRLAEFYPASADGTVLLRFPRLFIVAQA